MQEQDTDGEQAERMMKSIVRTACLVLARRSRSSRTTPERHGGEEKDGGAAEHEASVHVAILAPYLDGSAAHRE